MDKEINASAGQFDKTIAALTENSKDRYSNITSQDLDFQCHVMLRNER